MRAAIKAGDAVQVRALYDQASSRPDALLAIAVQNYNTASKHEGHVEIVDFLIGQGARPDTTAILEAARDGNLPIVERLVAAGGPLDILTCAAIGDLQRVSRFLKADRQLAQARTPQDTVHYANFTPLHCCCMSGLGRGSAAREERLLKVGELLVEYGAELEARASFYGPLSVTPLEMLAHTGGNLGLSRFLIGRGATITGFAFLEALSHRGRSPSAGLALAEQFLELGYDLNLRFGKYEGTALHACANGGAADLARWLLERGAAVNLPGRMGRTPLHLAAERNTSPRTARLLLDSGADPRAKDDLGLTPLAVARQHGKQAVVRLLSELP